MILILVLSFVVRDKLIIVHFHYKVSLNLSDLVLFLILPAFSDAFAYISPVVITL